MHWRRPLIVTSLILCGSVRAASAQSADWTGVWTGTFGTAAAPLEIVLRLEHAGTGWIGRIDLPSYGLFDARTRVSLAGDSVRLEIGDLRATFAGTRAGSPTGWFLFNGRRPGSDAISGHWRQDGGIAALRLVRTSADPSLRRPQEPPGLRPYREEDVRFAGPDGAHYLSGTLALPAGRGPHPAVVLISGSGPHDRDGSTAGHRPFLVLSDHLVRTGIAVLRFDERGVGASTGDFTSATTADFADDAAAALAFLAGHAEIDADRLGLVGHSEGGMVAPMVANRRAGVRFLVLLAAPGLSMAEVSIQQSESILRAEGRPDHEVAASRQTAERLMRLVRSTDDDAVIAAESREILAAGLAPLRLPSHLLERQLQLGVSRFTSPWMQFAARHDPGAELRRIGDIPVLALNGSRDAQVAAKPNLRAIRRALHAAGNRRVTTVELPGLNHLLQSAETGAPSEYGIIEETFAPHALQIVAEWMAASVPRGAP
jgi:uncharacterized protein